MSLGALSKLLQNLRSPHEFFVQDLGVPVVYHYTDLEALSSIVSGEDLWLTDSRYSNDYEEIEHGRRIVADVVSERIANAAPGEEREFFEGVQTQFTSALDSGVYVCCFCREDDLLGQWRSYGANGTGVSLGFNPDEFQFIAGEDMPIDTLGLLYMWRVFYKTEKQRNIVNNCLDEARQPHFGGLAERIKLAAEALRFFVPTFKNVDFKDEDEIRLVFLPAAKCEVAPRFRAGSDMLIPYYSVSELAEKAGSGPWTPPLTAVRVGPGANRMINKRSVELFLATKGLDGVTVDVSATPYRG